MLFYLYYSLQEPMVLSHTLDVLSKYNIIIKSLKLEQEYNNMDENKSK